MQTDNKAMVADQIEKAANKYVKAMDKATPTQKQYSREDFTAGANWQKEALKPLIDNHAEMLGIIKTICFWFGNEANYPIGTNGYNIYVKAQIALGNAQNLIQQ